MSRPSEAGRDGEWAGDGFDNPAEDGTGPYRVLLAQVLWLAANDLKSGSREDCLDAYKWINGLDRHARWFEFVCESLNLRVAWVRDQLTPPAMAKCEKWLREDAQERARARQEREQADEATRVAAACKRAAQAHLEARRLERALLKQRKVRAQWRTQQRTSVAGSAGGPKRGSP